MVKSKDLVYIEPIIASNHLILFIISNNGIECLKIKIDGESFKNNLKLLSFNLSSFKLDELKNFILENFGYVRKEFFNFLKSHKYEAKEFIFLLNDSELDFLSHILFKNFSDNMLPDQINFSYSYLINERNITTRPLIFEILNEGRFQAILKSHQQKQINKVKPERSFRVGIGEEFKEASSINVSKNSKANCLLVEDKLIINQASPEYSFLLPENSKDKSTNKELMKLISILDRKYELILFNHVKYTNLNEISRFISLFHFTDIPCIVISLNKNSQEFSVEFLYNYEKSGERFSMNEFLMSYYRSSLENSVKRNSTGWVSIIRINN